MNTNLLKICRNSLLGLLFGTALMGTASASIIYFDDFSGSSANDLNGTTPDVTVGSNTWASTTWTADGSINGYGSAVLAFTPVNGNVYTLSALLNNTNGQWITIGFVDTLSSPNVLFQPAVVGIGLNGPGSTEQAIVQPTTSTYSVPASGLLAQIVLNTTNVSNWTADFYYGGNLLQSSSLGTPTLVGIGMGSYFTAGSVDNFTLSDSAVPEPSTYALMLVGLGALVFLRRRVTSKS